MNSTTNRLPVVALLSSEAKMPFPGWEMKAAVRFNSSAYGLLFSKLEVITTCPGAAVRKLLSPELPPLNLSTPLPRNALRDTAPASAIASARVSKYKSLELDQNRSAIVERNARAAAMEVAQEFW